MLPFTPAPKPEPKKKKAKHRLGGAKSSESGKRYEREFVNETKERHKDKADLLTVSRVVGSGAFGKTDPYLEGDIKISMGRATRVDAKRLRLLLETKAYDKFDGRGERTITFPLDFIDKIIKEADRTTRIPGLVYHPKNTNREILAIDVHYVLDCLLEQEKYIAELESQLEEVILVEL